MPAARPSTVPTVEYQDKVTYPLSHSAFGRLSMTSRFDAGLTIPVAWAMAAKAKTMVMMESERYIVTVDARRIDRGEDHHLPP